MKISKKLGATLGAVALLAGGSGIALAAIPDSDDGEFHACVANTGPVRAMYAIDAEGSETCAAGYSEKAWSTEPTTIPSMKIVKKSKLSPAGGGNFTFGGNCGLGEGYVATGITYKLTPAVPQSIGDLDVMIHNESLNPDGTDPGAWSISAVTRPWPNPSGVTSGQVTIEARVTCIKNILAE